MNTIIPCDPEPLSIDTARTALIVVDMQNAFCKKGGMMDLRGSLDEGGTGRVIATCRDVLAAARNHDMPVFYLRMTYGLDVDAGLGPDSPFYWKEIGLEAVRRDPSLADRFLTSGSWGWDIIEELAPQPGDTVVDKSRFSGFVRTDLDAWLRAAGIRYLLFTGVYTNICVESTLRDAFHRDYFPILVRDACGPMGREEAQEAAIRNIQAVFGWMTTSDDLIKSLG